MKTSNLAKIARRYIGDINYKPNILVLSDRNENPVVHFANHWYARGILWNSPKRHFKVWNDRLVVRFGNYTYVTWNTISRYYFIKNMFYWLYQPTKLICGPLIVFVYHIDNYIKEGRNLHFYLLKWSTTRKHYPDNLGVSVFQDNR